MRKSRERGNAFVELALVLVPLFGLLLAILDFGFAIFLRSTLQHAVREGVRYGITYQTIDGMGHDDSIKTVVQQNALGFLSSAESEQSIQIRYYLPDTLSETSANAPGNLLEVSVENYEWGWMAPLVRSDSPLVVTARALDRTEPLVGGGAPPAR